jgi:hypothetical protein
MCNVIVSISNLEPEFFSQHNRLRVLVSGDNCAVEKMGREHGDRGDISFWKAQCGNEEGVRLVSEDHVVGKLFPHPTIKF